jgi:exosome complex component RRP4
MRIVIPGEVVAERPERMENTYIQEGRTYAKVLGMYDSNGRGIIPLEGAWMPRSDDTVVGIVSEVRNKVYVIDLSYFGRSLLIPGKYEEYSFSVGDVIEARIKEVENRRTIILSEAKPLSEGTVMSVKPRKVLRIIGKKNTMVNQIAGFTKTSIIVGLNGLIWLRGGDIGLASEAIRRVEREAHVSGLTETIRRYLEEKTGTKREMETG